MARSLIESIFWNDNANKGEDFEILESYHVVTHIHKDMWTYYRPNSTQTQNTVSRKTNNIINLENTNRNSNN